MESQAVENNAADLTSHVRAEKTRARYYNARPSLQQTIDDGRARFCALVMGTYKRPFPLKIGRIDLMYSFDNGRELMTTIIPTNIMYNIYLWHTYTTFLMAANVRGIPYIRDVGIQRR